MDYGLKNGTRTARLSGTWDLVAIKDWDVGLGAALYGDRTAFFGGGVSVKF
jgi:hypothetical protein